MPKLPFGRRPLPVAPGSSHYISNALIIAARVALGLEDPVRIQFSAAGVASESLSDWCRRHSDVQIRTMQLRKEQKAPFFHEYIAFSLQDNGGYFRIDRRQLPNEATPLACTEDAGVEAFETIEEITDLEHSMYSPSECLVQVHFDEGVRLELLIDICREISQHELASVYTVQRYNCYFYAQTLLLCALCKEFDWYENYIWGSGNGYGAEDRDVLSPRMSLANLEMNSRITIKILNKQPAHLSAENDTVYSNSDLLAQNECNSAWRSPVRIFRAKRQGSWSSVMKETSMGDLQEYLSGMIHAHSVRVEQYKLLLKCNASDVEWDIKKAINEIWRKRWLVLGQVEEIYPTLSQPRARDLSKRRRGQKGGGKDGRGSEKAKIGYGSDLRRRERVATKKTLDQDWIMLDASCETTGFR